MKATETVISPNLLAFVEAVGHFSVYPEPKYNFQADWFPSVSSGVKPKPLITGPRLG